MQDLSWPKKPFDHVVVVPAYNEAEALPALLASIRTVDYGVDALIICVLNASEDSASSDLQGNFDTLRTAWPGKFSAAATFDSMPRLLLFSDDCGGSVLLVNRFTPGHLLPEGEGVGLARKIGADLALWLHDQGHITSPWMHMTDADAQVPKDYFIRVLTITGSASAAVFPFQHIPKAGMRDLGDGLLVYDLFLRDYESSLLRARSPYGFQTIGSILLIRFTGYTAVRGFPKRKAAEDFYLLNKLAKIGGVQTLRGLPMLISERHSARVPFGTGASTMKLEKDSFDQLVFYANPVFHELALLLIAFGKLSENSSLAGESAFVGISEGGQAALKSLGFDLAKEAIFKNYRTSQLRLRHLHEWFDGFRTMRWIRLVSEKQWPKVSARQKFAPGSTDGECRQLLDTISRRYISQTH